MKKVFNFFFARSKGEYIFLACGICVMLIVLALIPKGNVKFDNAAVNQENGDIAITYSTYLEDDDGNDNLVIYLFLYDESGNLLFSKEHVSKSGGSYSEVVFFGETVHLYLSRDDVSYGYDREGKAALLLSSQQWDDLSSDPWTGWEKEYGGRSYTTDNYVYCYEQTPYPKNLIESECSMQIKNKATGETVLLLELNSKND